MSWFNEKQSTCKHGTCNYLEPKLLAWLEEKHGIKESDQEVYFVENGELKTKIANGKKYIITQDDIMEYLRSK
jgi:hypothetical protein